MNIRTSVESKRGYLAGLIDGDGSILLIQREKAKTVGDRARRISFGVSIRVGGEPNHLRRLREEFDNIGRVWIRKRDGQRHLAEWTIAGNQARQCLTSLLPHLRLKQDQAALALATPRCRSRWDATPELRAEQNRCWQEMKRLNHRYGRGRLAQ